jgi:hypothetical protein
MRFRASEGAGKFCVTLVASFVDRIDGILLTTWQIIIFSIFWADILRQTGNIYRFKSSVCVFSSTAALAFVLAV